MPNFEAFPGGNRVETNERDKQEQDLRFMLNRSYDQSGQESPLDRIQHSIDDYPALSQQDIIDIYLDEQEYETVANFIDKFPEVDSKAVASKLIAAGQGSHVLRNLDKFNGVSREDVERGGLQPQAEQSDRQAA
jgi:hypothetical protein